MSFAEGNNLPDLDDVNSINEIDSDSSEKSYSSISSNASQPVNSIPLITIDSGDEDEQFLDNKKVWAELPSLVVENIYSFLSRADQSRMSQVCTRWAKDFNSPILWKTIKFHLPEHEYSSEIYPEVRFARKYAPMFQHVEIISKTIKTRLIDVICRQLKLFLKAIESSQLVSIKFINMGHCFRRLDDILYQDVFQAIISFFSSQQNLKTVVCKDSHFSKENAMELLNAIFHNNNSTIRNIYLQGFVSEDPMQQEILSQQYFTSLTEICSRISNVQFIETDYTNIFEDIMNCLYAKISSVDYQLDKKNCRMSTLSIYCDGKRHSDFRGILPETWKHLRRVFRDLKVKMDVTIHSHLNTEMEKFLVKEMPLQELDFRYENLTAPARIDISSLINHLRICRYEGRLEALNILWYPNADFAGSIVPFVQSCRILKSLHIHVTYAPSGLHNILMELLGNHPTSLRVITFWFSYVNAEHNEDSLRALSEEFYPLFKLQSIDCFLLMDSTRRNRNRARNVIDD